MKFERVPPVADDQAGTFTRDQARAADWTARQVRRRLSAGRWRYVAGAALCSAQQVIGPWQLSFAVTLTWPDAVVSDELAGAIYGFPVQHVCVGTAIVNIPNHRDTEGLRTRRVPLPASDVWRYGGVAITTRRRTAVDLLRILSWSEARSLWAWLSTRQVLALADVQSEAEHTPGRHGTPQLRRLAEASAHGSLSAAEDVLHDILRCGLVTGWRANAPVLVDGRVIAIADVLFEVARLVIEVDGYEAHSSPEAFQQDRIRQNQIVGAGYQVLRFTWVDLNRRPLEVLASIRAALGRST